MIDTKTFVLAGDATFTVTSLQSGTRFTYQVEKSKDKPFYYVSVLTGPDNWSNYKYLGILNLEGQFYFARPEKAKVAKDAPSARGFEWFWRHLTNPAGGKVEQVKVSHEGKCCRCGRKLTVPRSTELGLGPECAEFLGVTF